MRKVNLAAVAFLSFKALAGFVSALVCRADAAAEARNGSVVADFLSKGTEERVAIIADLSQKSKFRNVVPRPEDGPPRFMAVDGVSNVRDIGGWKGLGGRRVRHGRAYRSAAFDTGVTFRCGGRAQYEYRFGLSPVTEDEKNDYKSAVRTITDKGIDELVHDLGIRSDLDLRSPHECYQMKSSPLGPQVKWFHCPLKTYGQFGDDDAREAFAKAFRVFLDESNYPIIFHCAGGADRTGAVAFMVNGICGVSLDDLRKDWELTAFGTAHAENPGFTHAKRFDRLVAVVDKMPGETLTDRVAAYVKSCGFTDADIKRVREIMLTPEEGDADILFKGAQWIGQPESLGAAAPRFTTRFKVARGGPAEIAVCGLGQYVVALNGKPLGRGDEFNLPGWTKTSKTCFYNVFCPVLKAGEENTLEITLGDGMYNVPSPGGDLYTKFTGSEGEKKLLVGGTLKSSLEGWTVSASDVVRTHVFSGDDIDRTADVSRVVPVVAAEAPKGVLREAPFVCRLQEVKDPVRTMRVSEEELTVDFGQNAAYVPTVVAKGPRGSRIEAEFAEMPLAEGESHLPEEATTHRKGGITRCRFTLAGNGADETFTTPFFYYGFRYMRVRLLPAHEGGERPMFVSAEARVVMADMPSIGSFLCSVPLFNKIHEICRWAQRSNMQSVFTDCPHREKLGWQEEDHIHADQIRWGWNADALFAKTCMDIADSQLGDGLCPCIAPEFVVFRPKFRDSIEWGSSIIQIPLQQYEWTDDDSLIRRYWPNMVAYHNYIRSQAHDFIARGGLGDWCQETSGGTRPVRRTSNALTATAFYYQNAVTLAKFAEMLGRDGEAAEYRDEAEKIKTAFNAKWWRTDLHGYENNSQAANSLALAFGLADESERDAIVSNIVDDVRGRGNAVGTGEIGYPYLLKVLAENGHDDVIFDMTVDDTKPGYGWMIAKGNTSCHEAWDARPELSHNHFMMADIVNWFYGSLAGIRRTSPGFKTFIVEPKFLPGLDWVKASHRVAGGDIKVEWKREGDATQVLVSVPQGTTATVRLPGAGNIVQTPGERTYEILCDGTDGENSASVPVNGVLSIISSEHHVVTTSRTVKVKLPVQFSAVGKWSVGVDADGDSAKFDIEPPLRMVVVGERHDEIPVFNPKRAGWKRGVRLEGVLAYECSVRFALDVSSVSVRTVPDGRELKRDVDYRLDPGWGTVGWVDENAKRRFGAVSISYAYSTRRIDSVVRCADGKIVLKKGSPHVATPRPPALSSGETLLGNVFVDAQTDSLGPRNLFPVIEPTPKIAKSVAPPAEKLLPRTWAKLNNGERVTILAWGDSVTDGFFLPVSDKWQKQFAARLRKLFPKADVRLISNGWSGRKSNQFFAAPPESPYNFTNKVAGVKADLVISEFVNDCGQGETIVLQDYPKYLKAFRDAGSEWIIMTPHYVRPDWMGLTTCKQTDEDPRPFVKALRAFAAENGIALADASRRWGHLWREGIPFSTMFVNDINHPVADGMTLFADALMGLFGGDAP